MLLGAIFAGHHTSSGTAAWVLLEMLKQPKILHDVRNEIEGLLGTNGEVTFQSLREVPKLENVLKEVLRLHPPLIVLMRKVEQDLPVGDYLIKKGDMVWAAPPVTQRIGSLFPNPELFDPDRYTEGREEDKNLDAYQPFGGGKHKCSGNAFAMFQIKAIFCILLRRYEFELIDAPESYVDDYTQMIVQPKAPCRVRYKRRAGASGVTPTRSATQQTPSDTSTSAASSGCPFSGAAQNTTTPQAAFSIALDKNLCQGHAVCAGEAPELFRVDAEGNTTVLAENIKPELLTKALRAEKFCPNKAIKINVKN